MLTIKGGSNTRMYVAKNFCTLKLITWNYGPLHRVSASVIKLRSVCVKIDTPYDIEE